MTVYANRAREAFPGIFIMIGGMEASLRRFAHYDYWEDKVRRSVLADSKADILVYGMGECATRELAKRLDAGRPVTGILGTCVWTAEAPKDAVLLPSYEEVCADKQAYARATAEEYRQHDPVRGKALVQPHGERLLLCYPPATPLDTAELDEVAALPYTREPHPIYDDMGGVPAIEEVRFSVIHNRGCFGGCAFCSLAFHQGRMVTSRSHESVIREVEEMTRHPLWRGYVADVGGPTANFRGPSCQKQLKHGMCPDRRCLAPEPCPNLQADHTDYLALLRKLRAIPGVKKVFVRSGVRFDYVLYDKDSPFLSELVKHHVSGRLKVAPEHCVDKVLSCMGKPPVAVYQEFMDRYRSLNEQYSKEQFIVPYLMSSHPGSSMQSAIELAMYLRRNGLRPEQVQDFYPTPGTISTCMYYTGLDPMTMKNVYVPRSPREKTLQRALLQYYDPRMAPLVRQALQFAGREDLIGTGKGCLVKPGTTHMPEKGEKPLPEKGGRKANAPPSKGGKPGKDGKAAGKGAKPPTGSSSAKSGKPGKAPGKAAAPKPASGKAGKTPAVKSGGGKKAPDRGR